MAGVATLVLVVGGVGAWLATRPSASAAAAPVLATATTGTLRQTVSATGTIEPASRADLSFGVGGTVKAVDVAVGQKVRVGQTLATLDTTDLSSAVDLAQASLTAAQSQQTSLEAAGASSTQIASATAQVAAAQSKLADARTALAQATLTSPIGGTVASVSLSPGDRVGSGTSSSGSSAASGAASGASSGGASGGGSGSASGGSGGGGGSGSGASATSTAQFVVIATTSWQVDAEVGSADLAALRPGLQAEITPTGSATRVFGTVKSVGIIASSSSGTATFPVTITVTGNPSGLYAGGSADVAIVVKQLSDVLTVPTSALHTEGGRTVVHQLRRGQQVSTPVTVGAVYGFTTQVLSGLTDGDQVVLPATRGGLGGANGTGRTRQGGFGGGGFGGGGFGAGAGGFGGGGFGGGAGGAAGGTGR